MPKRMRELLLEDIALDGFVSEREVFSDTALTDWIRSWLGDNSTYGIGPERAEDVLKVLLIENGLLTVHRPGSLRFLHLTFQEYLAASCLVRLHDWKQIVEKFKTKTRWEEVLRLLAALMPDASDLIRLLWNGTEPDDIFSTKLHRAGRILGETRKVDQDLVIDLARRLLESVYGGEIGVIRGSAVFALARVGRAFPGVYEAIHTSVLGKGDNTKFGISVCRQTKHECHLPVLLRVLENPETSIEVKIEVVEALGAIGDDLALPMLRRVCFLGEPNISNAAVNSIAEIGGSRAVSELISLLQDRQPLLKISACAGLEKTGASETTEYLLAELFHEDQNDDRILIAISHALIELGDGDDALDILGRLESSNSLGKRAGYVGYILSFLLDGMLPGDGLGSAESLGLREDIYCQEFAMGVLLGMIQTAPEKSFEILCKDRDTWEGLGVMQGIVLRSIGRGLKSAALGWLLDIACDVNQDTFLRCSAITAVGTIRKQESSDKLAMLIRGGEGGKIAISVIETVSAIGGKNAVRLIEEELFLKRPDLNMRRILYKGLGEIGTPECLTHLRRALTDERSLVGRKDIYHSIFLIQSSEAKEIIKKCVTSIYLPAEIRSNAALALGRQGTLSDLSILEHVLMDEAEDEEVRNSAAIALMNAYLIHGVQVPEGNIPQAIHVAEDTLRSVDAEKLIALTERFMREKGENQAQVKFLLRKVLGHGWQPPHMRVLAGVLLQIFEGRSPGEISALPPEMQVRLSALLNNS